MGAAAALSAFPHIVRSKRAASKSQPSILFILTDDLGYGDLGCYGHPHIKTPYLDLLAKEGMRLTNCYSPSPLCSPSRAGFLTGRTPYRTGIESWIPEGADVFLHRNEKTLATLLKEQGYATFVGGKWHLNGKFNSPEHPQPDDHGFDHWLATPNFTKPTHQNPTNFVRNGKTLAELEGFSAQIVVDEAIQWVRERDLTKPFFQYVSLHEPHSEIASPETFNRMYSHFTKGEADPPNLTDRGPGEYFANVTHLDYQIGRLLKNYDWLGLRQNTLVFFTSDNGPVTENWRHWWEINMYGSTGGLKGRKADLYEGGIRVPGILRYPGRIKPSTQSAVPVHGYDLLPTICRVAGVAIPDDREIDGQSFDPLWRGGSINRKQPLYWQFATHDTSYFGDSPFLAQYAIRDGNWKLIANKEMDRFELFDLAQDPAESINLAGRKNTPLSPMIGKMEEINRSVASDELRP